MNILRTLGMVKNIWGTGPIMPPPPQIEENDCRDSEVISSLVYRELQKTLRGTNDLNVTNKAALDREQAEIDRIRAWATTLADRKVKAQYNSWLTNYYQHGLAYKELRTRSNEKEMAEYRAKNDAHYKKVLECQGSIPVPPEEK